MDGLKTLAMKMKYDSISKHDVLELYINLNGMTKKSKYLTVSISRDYIKLLPLAEYFKNNNFTDFIVPCIDMPFSMIKKYKKLDKSNLLYLVNSGNPHIILALDTLKD